MLFPLSDDDRKLTGPAYVTIALIAINVIAFMLQQTNPDITYGWSVVPQEITTNSDLVEPVPIEIRGQLTYVPQVPGPTPIWLTLITCMFLHGSLMHLGSNLLYLWIFGDNVEHRFGPVKFLLFYLAAGIAASFAQIVLKPDSVIPTLGASGAISGVLGAYLVLFPRNKVKALLLYMVVTVPAILVLGMWIGMQLVNGTGSLFDTGGGGGVAYAAHIGGFVAGLLVALAVRKLGFHDREPDSVLKRQYEHDPRSKRYW